VSHRLCFDALLYSRCGWCERVMWPWQAKVHGPIYGYPIDHAPCHDERLAAAASSVVTPRNYC
jgi:hypothetical protein